MSKQVVNKMAWSGLGLAVLAAVLFAVSYGDAYLNPGKEQQASGQVGVVIMVVDAVLSGAVMVIAELLALLPFGLALLALVKKTERRGVAITALLLSGALLLILAGQVADKVYLNG